LYVVFQGLEVLTETQLNLLSGLSVLSCGHW